MLECTAVKKTSENLKNLKKVVKKVPRCIFRVQSGTCRRDASWS